jgi:hypothetical protein
MSEQSSHPSGAGNGGTIPPVEHRFKSGNPGGPGRKTCGASLREHLNYLANDETMTEEKLRGIVNDKRSQWARRAAAQRVLRSIETGDLADMEGDESLEELRAKGVNTEVIKRLRTRRVKDKDGREEVTREIELHDRGGEEFDRLCGQTDISPSEKEKYDRCDEGKPTELFGAVEFIVPGLPKG